MMNNTAHYFIVTGETTYTESLPERGEPLRKNLAGCTWYDTKFG